MDADLRHLLSWSDGAGRPDSAGLRSAVDGVVALVADQFERAPGRWR